MPQHVGELDSNLQSPLRAGADVNAFRVRGDATISLTYEFGQSVNYSWDSGCITVRT